VKKGGNMTVKRYFKNKDEAIECGLKNKGNTHIIKEWGIALKENLLLKERALIAGDIMLYNAFGLKCQGIQKALEVATGEEPK
jgi:hypothetical protein